MKIDRSKSKKSSSDVPFDCKILIEELKSCDEDQLLIVLKRIKTWSCGKCELYHWIDVLDIFDSILEECCRKDSAEQWVLPVDMAQNSKKRELLLAVISFTSLLIEHSFSRHLYNSIEHLITLLSSTDMQIVLAILNLLFVFSKRSNFFSRINSDKRQSLLSRLYYLAENWGGKDQGFGLAQCCQDLPLSSYPSNATTFNFEFYSNNPSSNTIGNVEINKIGMKGPKGDQHANKKTNIVRINIENVHLIDKPVSQIMAEIVDTYKIPNEQQMQIFTQLRLTKNFASYPTRLQCVQARLNALSIMVYCQAMALQDTYYQLLYNGLIEELVEVLELKQPELIEIKSASLKTLTSIIHLDRNSKLKVIIDSTGANSYHGFLPILVRNCINSLISGNMEEYPLNFVTALFSFLYHLASYDNGCEALVLCGIMESLLRVVDWKGPEPDHITFVTRAVRVIDLLTNRFIDMNAFQSNNGLNTFVQRLEYEVNICRAEQPYEIEVPADKINKEKNSFIDDDEIVETIETQAIIKKDEPSIMETPMEVEVSPEIDPQASTSINGTNLKPLTSLIPSPNNNLQCYPQRAALLKSMLNFLKKAVQCTGFSESIRPLMYGNFPRSLRHIISNAEYYGSSLFLLATDVVSVYVYQEPSLLSVIQDNGLTDVVLHALLVKDVPSTKEVLASLPTVFTSLCLNHRGLEAFVALRPFERLFKIFMSPDYLQAMRRRRSESTGDTATCLGNAMDELMRHQPSLRADAIGAIIKLLEEICNLGSDPKYICTKASSSKSSTDASHGGPSTLSMTFNDSNNDSRNLPASNVNNDSSSSEEDDDYDDDTTTTAEPPTNVTSRNAAMIPSNSNDDSNVSLKLQSINRSSTLEQNRQQIPLIDYILNVMRFVDAILSKNSTDDHCQEFLHQKGLEPLFKLLKLPNLPLDFPVMPACYSIAGVFKSLLNLAHEKDIFTKGLEKLKEILEKLDPLSQTAKTFNGSILLEDLINHISSKKSTSAINFVTPVLQSMAAAHSYIIMFIHICRTGQGEIRSISISQWGSNLGIEIINLLSSLYIALVWESTLLLGLNDSTSQKYEFVKIQIEKLNALLKNNMPDIIVDNAMSPMEVDFDNSDAICSNCGNRSECPTDNTGNTKNNKSNSKSLALNTTKNAHQKYIKPLLTVASRLGRALAELFGLLVKLCVGTSIRRRSHHSQPYFLGNSQPMIPSKPAQNIAKHLNILLYNGLSWQPSFDTNIPKFRLTFYVCSIGFSSPMLFDDRKFPYHVMLRNFVLNGGQDAFFECFNMALEQQNIASGSNNELTDGIIEFLDSWLLLLEKMTNPQTLFDSPHAYTASKTNDLHQEDIHFDPMQYLIRTHKKAFPCIMELWNNKLYKIKCDRIIESLITIFSHVLKGETIIEKHSEKISSEAGPTGSVAGSSSELILDESSSLTLSRRMDPHVQTLIEMGFSRELAIDALMNAGDDVNAATEWILQHNPRYFSAENEEEEMIRAIALSLSDNSRDVESYLKSIEDKNKQEKLNANQESKDNKEEPLVNEVPLKKEDINSFTNQILVGILKLIDQLPSIVHKCCELLISISKRNGKKWFEEILSQLIEDIMRNISDLQNHTSYIKQPTHSKTTATEWAQKLSTLPEATQLTSRIHLLVLLFNEAKNACVKQINQSLLLNNLIELLENASYLLNVAYEKEQTITTPKWVAPIILLIDLYEKNDLASRRRKRLLLESANARRTWKYFDERSARWASYQPDTNKTIDEAFRNGEQYCRIQVARRRYTVNFTSMVQINDETGNYRPVMFFVDLEKSNDKDKQQAAQTNKFSEKENDRDKDIKNDKSKKSKEKDNKDIRSSEQSEDYLNDFVEVDFLDSKQCRTIIKSMVNLIQLPIDPDTLNAIIRLCLRLTRNYENACLFIENNGISTLLKIPQSCVFPGFVSLTTLIIRHILEDKQTLKVSMDKIIRLQTNSPNSIREMHYLFRFLSPAACRDLETFKQSAMSILRINVPLSLTTPRRMNQDDERLSTLLRTVNPNTSKSTNGNSEQQFVQQQMEISYDIPKIAKDIICELLNMLPLKYVQQITNQKNTQEYSTSESSSEAKTEGEKISNETNATTSVATLVTKDQDVFYTHTILSILAELTKSYYVVAKVICEHTYSIGYTDSILEDCSAISFILDNLLSHAQNYGDKDCATYSRALFAAIASVPFLAEIHQTLVIEIKNALNRAVLLPESIEKHAKIQALSALITSIVEAQCPTFHHQHQYYRSQFVSSSSPVIKLLIRKNLITDLAKIIQFLDLSSPMMTTTVNSLLKTLEFLSKTLNTPQNPLTSRQQQSQQQNRQRNILSHSSFTIPLIDLDSSGPVGQVGTAENDTMIMEQDQSENLTANTNVNSSNNHDTSSSLQINQQTAGSTQNTNAIQEDINNTSTMSNTLDNSQNLDENTENELFLDSVAYDYNHSHPRSGTFTSDELRTDDDDDENDAMVHDQVHNDVHTEMHDNAVNPNHVGVESTSSDDTESEDSEEEEDSEDDVELEEEDEEEEEQDGAGSAQEDEHEDDEEDDDEDEHMDEDEEDEDGMAEDYAIHAIFDDSLRYPDSNDVIFNLEEVLPHVLHVRDRMPSSAYFLPFLAHGDETGLNVHGHHQSSNHYGQHSPHSSSIQVQHPLLSYNSDQMSSSGPGSSLISNVGNSLTGTTTSNLSAQYFTTSGSRMPRNPRHRALRSYIQTGHNWHVAHFNSRNNPSQILQRLLGSTSPHPDFQFPGVVRNAFSRHDHIDLRDEFYDLHPLTYASNSSYQNFSLNSIPSTITRWYEESRILDGEYMYDSMLLIKPEIIKHLEKLKEEEIQEKKRKEKEEMDTSSSDSTKKSINNGANLDSAARNMQSAIQSGQRPQFDELHAHIEQLTTSVINQVLESNPSSVQPSNQQHQQQQGTNNSTLTNGISEESNTTVSNFSNQNMNVSRMEVVTNEEPQQPLVDEVIPMSIVNENIPPSTDESLSTNNVEESIAITVNQDTGEPGENVDELMDHSSMVQEPEQETAPSQVRTNSSTTEQISTPSSSTTPAPPQHSNYQLTPEERAILGDQELPEGVDPSFLAALPENIRQEVIAEQFRLQRLNYLRTQPSNAGNNTNNASSSVGAVTGANTSNSNTFAEVNPEFLAALPPNIQEEVLAQQRAEQQRLNAQNTNPDTPVDPVSFFRSLPPSLRRQVLSDLDDSQVQLLPPEFANEARALRREYEMRNRQIHERLFSSNTAISRIIRSATSASRARYDALNIPNWTFARLSLHGPGGSQDNRDGYSSLSRNVPRAFTSRSVKGKYLLDYDALSSILILLFIHDNLISSIRLHRLIKNLCFHTPTRQWIIQSLLEIMEKTKESVDNTTSHNNTLLTDDQTLKTLAQNHFVSWLSITLNSSFGSKTNVFYINKSNQTLGASSKKSNQTNIYTISINPQASLFVCRNVLDILISLAKTFPDQFISYSSMPSLQKNLSATSLNTSSSSIKESQELALSTNAVNTPSSVSNTSTKPVPSFFDVLMRHDFIHVTKKTKSKQASSSSNLSQTIDLDSSKSIDYSPFSQLLNLLSHHFIKKSPMLTDRLIRLMTYITTALTSDSDTRNHPTPINLSNEIKEKLNEIEKTIANERLLKLVVNVLVSKSCSEEGLVDATSLLIKLSNLFPNCRNIFYKLLLEGVRVLGETVYIDINALSLEMSELLFKLKQENPQTNENEQYEKNVKGQTNVQDRYSNMTIVINVQSNVKHNISGKEVQLPSMSNLISKSSSQFLFLRILKIIMHIREINSKNAKQQLPQNENSTSTETKMEVDSEQDKLSTELRLDHLWEKLSDCLSLLSEAPDDHVVLVLQPAVESFFLVHAPEKAKPGNRTELVTQQLSHIHQNSDSLNVEANNDSESRQYSSLPVDTQKFLIFAEKHRVVLNQILRQSNVHLANGPFAVLVDHTRILDFDVKRRYFRQELERLDQGSRRDDLPVHIRREHVFEDSYRELNRRTSDDWKNRFYIVFEGEEGQDAGGLLREWYTIISREIFNPNYALFTTSPGDRVTYMINSASHCNSNHLSYFKFVGRVISKAIHDNKLLDCYFTRSFYKHILGKAVKYTDMESEDYSFYQGLVFLLEHNVNELGTELTFSLEIQEFGVTEVRDLVPNGRNIIVTEENKHEYVKLVCQEKMTGSIKKQLNSFLEGFYEIIPKRLISIFNEHELELLISGLPNIDIDDLKANTDYHKYQATSLQIQWFWRALRTFDQADRAKFLQFVTGTSKVPLQGFSALEGMNGPQKFQIHLDDRSTDRLPSAHTCFNQLDLPAYETYDKLRLMLLKAIHECSEGFGFA